MMAEKPTNLMKGIAYAALTAAVVLAFLVVGSHVTVPKDNSPEAGMIEASANGAVGEPADSLDVLILGDSETYNGISPLQMWHEHGFTSYACASPGQTLAYSNTLLHRAYRDQHPKLVLIEIGSVYTDLTFADAAARTALDLFPVLEYHSRWKSLTPDDFTQQPKATWTDELKGFRVYEEWAPGSDDGYMAPTDERKPISAVNDMYLRIIVDYCREQGATPVLVKIPSTKNWNMAKRNYIEEWAREHGVDFIDLNHKREKADVDWRKHTKDGGKHLNYDGAVVATRKLGEVLAESYSLPDHRSDPAYAPEWDAAYANYMDIVKNNSRHYKEG